MVKGVVDSRKLLSTRACTVQNRANLSLGLHGCFY